MRNYEKHEFCVAILAAVAVLACLVPGTAFAQSGQGDPVILAMMHEVNSQLEALGLDLRLGQVELYTIGRGQPLNRILRNGLRWVPNDPWRTAQGEDITYLVDQSKGGTTSGLTNAQTEAAIDRAMGTWDSQKSLQKVDIVKRGDPGGDVTIFDFFVGYPGSDGFGNPYAADIAHAGWWPKDFFDWWAGPGAGDYIIAVSVTFYWTGPTGPVDKNGDNYVDTALNEIYYNDGFAWGINADLPWIDVETVALHESGHSLGLGHFGPPPEALMNPVYHGICQAPGMTDNAGVFSLYRSWPNP